MAHAPAPHKRSTFSINATASKPWVMVTVQMKRQRYVLLTVCNYYVFYL